MRAVTNRDGRLPSGHKRQRTTTFDTWQRPVSHDEVNVRRDPLLAHALRRSHRLQSK